MSLIVAHFQRLAAYNRIANGLIYDAAARLDPEELWRDRRAFFTSIGGTLNHILVGDRIWLARFEGGSSPSTGLDAILFEDLADLRAARIKEDARIERFAAGLTEAYLDGEIRYVNNQGRDMADPTAVLVPHFFNHQTHHRGQVHDMLSQTDVPPPSLDMHRCFNP